MDRVRRAEKSTPGRAPGRVATLWRSLHAPGRAGEVVRSAEQDGLAFAFRARSLAVAAVSAWLVSLVPWPRNVWYFGFAVAFGLLGYVPFRLRRHRHAWSIALLFVLLDVTLVAAVILVPPPGDLSIDWPVQTRLRGQVFLFLLLLLAEAALTYSPIRVLWTGASIVGIWSAGTITLYGLPDTTRYAAIAVAGEPSDADLLRMYVDPTYVSMAGWSAQVLATAILTVLLALAVFRSRRHLLAEARAEVAATDLARYVSPDVAGAVIDPSSPEFGRPATRDVAVLFADIVGFTSLTERLPPDGTFALLQSFQERSSRLVLGHGGTLDKYLGDGLMATFGALGDEPDPAGRALACAFALDGEVARWSAKRVARGAAPIRIAIGVHHGPVVVGNLGSERRIEFTVVGDVVNATSRLEKAAREFGCTLVASDACLRAAGDGILAARFARTVELRLRGRDAPLRAHLAGSVSCEEKGVAALGQTRRTDDGHERGGVADDQ